MKIRYLILALLFPVLVLAQATAFQRQAWWGSTILDSTQSTTVKMHLPDNRGKGLLVLYIWADDLDEDATHDSLAIDYRPVHGTNTGDTLTSSAGGGITWTPVQIYNGASGTLADWDNSITWVDSAWYMCILDLDGYPWRDADLRFNQTANDCTTADDSIKVYYYLDID